MTSGPGGIMWGSRQRRHSAPGDLYNLSTTKISSGPPLPVHGPLISKVPPEDLKQPLDQLQNPPFCWTGKENNSKDIYLPTFSSSKISLGNGGTGDFQNEKKHKNEREEPPTEDMFIEVEWDTSGVTGSEKQYYEDTFINDKSNAVVKDILVLKPKWLKPECRKVVFRDLHVDLFQCEVGGLTKKGVEERTQKLKSDGTPEIIQHQSSVKIDNPTTRNVTRRKEPDNPAILKEKTNDLSVTSKVPDSSSHKHKCELCGKEFKSKSHLFNHILSHTGEKPYKCGECGKRFRLKTRLSRHMQTHTGDKNFKCDTCGLTFSRCDHLKIHVQRTHKADANPHKCEDCNEIFSHKYKLTIHVGLEHKSASYRCRSCGTSFSQVSTLQAHVGRCGRSKAVKD